MINKCNMTTLRDELVADATHLDHVLLQLSVIDWCGQDEFIFFVDTLVNETQKTLYYNYF